MHAGSERMSNYLVEELTFATVGRRIFTVVDRAQLDLIREEMNFQMSGEVSDASAQAIGQKLGAQYIVTGTFESIGNYYRFRVRVIEVETAVIQVTYSANVQNDQVVASLLGSGVRTPASAPSAPSAPPAPGSYQDFTFWERQGTMALNFIPGLGSYVIMKDKVGGTIQLAVGGSGLIALIVGYAVLLSAKPPDDEQGIPDYEDKEYQAQFNSGVICASIGAGLYLGNYIFINGIRSNTYHKPRSQTALLIDPEAWNIAILPGKNGIEQVSLSYTLRF